MKTITLSIYRVAVVLGVWILSIALTIVITWIKRGADKDIEWQGRIATAEQQVTTSSTIVEVPQPPSSGTSPATPRPRPKPQPKPATASIPDPCAELRQENEALRLYQIPQGGRIQSPSIGTIDWIFYPESGQLTWDHTPPPMIIRIDTIRIKQIVLEERPWWEAPAYVAGGIVVGIIVDRSVR